MNGLVAQAEVNTGLGVIPSAARIAALDDVQAINAWLAGFADSPNTQSSYAKEANRFLIWMHSRTGRASTLSSVSPQDTLEYAAFLADPGDMFVSAQGGPRKGWSLASNRLLNADDIPNWRANLLQLGEDGWRPFRSALSASSRYQSKIVLFAMYEWLKKAKYLLDNPFDLHGLSKRGVSRSKREALGTEARRAMVLHARALADTATTDYQIRQSERDLWALSVALLAGARRGEIARAVMRDVYIAGDGWVWRIIGKGEKERVIPVTTEFMNCLARYRRALGLNAIPSTDGPDSLLPLVADVRNLKVRKVTDGVARYHLSPARINVIIKEIAKGAADALISGEGEQPPKSDQAAAQLRATVLHSLRHTAATGMSSSGIPVASIMFMFGHASESTTHGYIHQMEVGRIRDQLSKIDVTGSEIKQLPQESGLKVMQGFVEDVLARPTVDQATSAQS